MVKYQPRSHYRGSVRSGKSVAYITRPGELKGVDTSLSLSPVIATTNTNASSFVLNLIQSGTGSWNRIGKKIRLKSVRLRGVARFVYKADGTSGEINSNNLRMIVVWDKQPCGNAVPAFDQIFGRTDQDGIESTEWMDQLKYDNTGRFSVLRDVVFDMNPSTGNRGTPTGTVTLSHSFDEFIKLGGREVVYSGQSSPMTIADVSSGAVYVFFRI